MTSEAQFQEQVVDLAKWAGWLIHHDRRQDLSIAGDPGFPDLVLARKGRVIFAELKSAKGRLTDAQRSWFTELSGAAEAADRGGVLFGRVHFHVWRPHDLDDIARILSPRNK